MVRKNITYADLAKQAERIALHSAETKEQALARLLEANPEINAAYRAAHNRPSSKRICEALGIDERIVRQWQLRGILKIEARSRREKWRHYTFVDVVSLALMKRLVDAGFSGRHAADCINDNHKYIEQDPMRRFYLVLTRRAGRFGWVGDNSEIPEMMRKVARILEPEEEGNDSPGVVTIIAVHHVAREVQSKLFGG